MDIRLVRAYDPPSQTDGFRVLVDRLWPRGVSKTELALDRWDKDVAPSAELRKLWHADPLSHQSAQFSAFTAAYRDELSHDPARAALVALIAEAPSDGRALTLVYGARDTEVNHAVVLRDVLLELDEQKSDS